MHSSDHESPLPLPDATEAFQTDERLISLGLASTDYVRRTVNTIVRFLNSAGITLETEVERYLEDVDFTHPVSVRSLPMSVFVRSETYDGNWLTDTGLSHEQVRGLPFQSTQSLWTPISTMVALQARSKTVFSVRAVAALFPRLDPQRSRELKLRAHSVGVQFLTFDRIRLRRI
jgi:hypothetical protein